MTVMTLSEAIFQRLKERGQLEIEAQRKRKRESLEKELLISNIENAVRRWFVDELNIALPDELAIQIQYKYKLSDGDHYFDLRVSPKGEQFEAAVWPTCEWSYGDDGALRALNFKWGAKITERGSNFFGSFIDALIYSLGGEQGLRDMGILR